MANTRRDRLRPLLYLLPAILLLLVFSIFPVIYGLVVSLCRWGIVYERFVGLANYYNAIMDPEFRQSLTVTIYFVIGTVPVGLILSYIIASLLVQKLRGMGAYRTIYFLPYITSTVAAAAIWRWIFHPGDRGLANGLVTWASRLLGRAEVPTILWIRDPRTVFQVFGEIIGVEMNWGGPSVALLCVIIFSIWNSLGFNIVILLAALTAVPNEIYEAASIDGARGWRMARHVTIPLISPTIVFLIVISVIKAFQAFSQIYVMIGEDALPEAQNVTFFIFSKFYVSGEVGYGSAVAFILFLIIMLLTVAQMRLLSRMTHYS